MWLKRVTFIFFASYYAQSVHMRSQSLNNAMLEKVFRLVIDVDRAQYLNRTARQSKMNRSLMQNAMCPMPVHQLFAFSKDGSQFSTSVSSSPAMLGAYLLPNSPPMSSHFILSSTLLCFFQLFLALQIHYQLKLHLPVCFFVQYMSTMDSGVTLYTDSITCTISYTNSYCTYIFVMCSCVCAVIEEKEMLLIQ